MTCILCQYWSPRCAERTPPPPSPLGILTTSPSARAPVRRPRAVSARRRSSASAGAAARPWCRSLAARRGAPMRGVWQHRRRDRRLEHQCGHRFTGRQVRRKHFGILPDSGFLRYLCPDELGSRCAGSIFTGRPILAECQHHIGGLCGHPRHQYQPHQRDCGRRFLSASSRTALRPVGITG